MASLSSPKIKVMFIIDFIYTITGGTENQIIKLINNLDSAKYELYLVSLQTTPWLIENTSNLKCSIKTFKYNIFNHKDIGNIIVFWQITRYIKKVRPDIVMTFFKISYILGVLAARLAGVKNIISTRRDYGLWLDKRSIHLLRFANRFVKGIIANSKSVEELIGKKEKYDKSRITVIYNGIDVNQFKNLTISSKAIKERLGISPDNKVVGIVAGLRTMKRHRTFLKAAAKVLKQNNSVDFLIVGDGPLKEELEAFCRELQIGRYVHFVGWAQDAIQYLSIFDIGINCSSNEGLSNAIMEYMAYGIPCIVSDAGGNTELIENGVNGYTFELGNHQELARLILDLLDNKEKREKFILRSKNRIKDMSLDKMISNYERYFTELLNNSNGSNNDKQLSLNL